MFIDVQQNSDEWFDLRIGKITSSNMGKIMANYGKSFGQPAKEYAEKIALEYVTGCRDESSSYSNSFMERGNELEPLALIAYEEDQLISVSNGGFYVQESEHIIKIGDSPDGNIGKNGCIEIKSVIPKTHWKRLKKGGIDTAYQWQIMSHIWIGGKEWCDFVSYCPEMPESKQLYIERVYRDEEAINKMKIRIAEFRILIEDNINILES